MSTAPVTSELGHDCERLTHSAVPRLSIILPTYNRAQFLPTAFEAIRAQTFADWELIVVDDGSTDATRELVPQFAASIGQPVRYVFQDNQGAYGARNTGLDLVRGDYVAFYDSDDAWLPHHLQHCVDELDKQPAVDWVYGACRIVDHHSGNILDPNTFIVGGKPRPFRRLRVREEGRLHIIEDRGAVRCMILHGLYNGLQNSVIRSTVFRGVRFESTSRNEAEDQLFVIRALARGHRLAYLDDVHVEYRIHGENSSGAAQNVQLEKRLRIQKTLIEQFERLPAEIELSSAQKRALGRRLSRECFWLLGYALLWEHGRRVEALEVFRRGMSYAPWNLAFLKTYSLAQLKVAVSRLLL